MNTRLLRRPDVLRLTGLSYSTIFRLERVGQFPARRRISENTVGWIASEVEGFIADRAVVRPVVKS